MHATEMLRFQLKKSAEEFARTSSALTSILTLLDERGDHSLDAAVLSLIRLLQPLGLCVIHCNSLRDIKQIVATAQVDDDEGLSADSLALLKKRIDQSLNASATSNKKRQSLGTGRSGENNEIDTMESNLSFTVHSNGSVSEEAKNQATEYRRMRESDFFRKLPKGSALAILCQGRARGERCDGCPGLSVGV